MAGPLADLASSVLTGVWLYVELRYLNRRQARSLVAEMPAQSSARVGF